MVAGQQISGGQYTKKDIYKFFWMQKLKWGGFGSTNRLNSIKGTEGGSK